MSQELVKAMNDLYGNVSFGGPSSGGGGGGGGSSFSGPALEQERRNAGVSGHTRGRHDIYSPVGDFNGNGTNLDELGLAAGGVGIVAGIAGAGGVALAAGITSFGAGIATYNR